MVNIDYIPVDVSPCTKKYKGRSVVWWSDDNPIFFYPHLLISAYGRMDTNVRSEWNISDNVRLMLDSSGFQVVTKNYETFCLRVLKWQESVSNDGDIALILDRPPYKATGSRQFGGNASDLFEFSLKKTIENAKTMLKHKNNDGMKLYGVVQGETWKQMNRWCKEITRDLEFDGMALSPKPSNDPFQIAKYMMLARDNDFKNIHILQVSGINALAVIYYASTFMNCKNITFDSSSQAAGRERREYKFKGLNLYFGDRVRSKVKKLPCGCPVCKTIDINDLYNGENEIIGRLIEMHNLYQILSRCKILDSLKDDREVH